MLSKSQVKYIQSLGHKKFRDADGVFVAEGPKIVQELLHSDHVELVNCFATPDWLESRRDKYADKLFTEVDEQDLQKISFHPSPKQVLAVFRKPVFQREKEGSRVCLMLETIQDPGNMGTIIRTADWFGVQMVICSPDSADVFSPKVVQAAMGSISRVEVCYAELTEYIERHPDLPLYAASLDGEPLNGNEQISEGILLFGNESRGLSPALEELAVRKWRIPGRGGAESLNVAVAAGIFLSRVSRA